MDKIEAGVGEGLELPSLSFGQKPSKGPIILAGSIQLYFPLWIVIWPYLLWGSGKGGPFGRKNLSKLTDL